MMMIRMMVIAVMMIRMMVMVVIAVMMLNVDVCSSSNLVTVKRTLKPASYTRTTHRDAVECDYFQEQ